MADRKSNQLGTPDVVYPTLLSLLVAASTTIYAGDMVAVNSSGYAVPASGTDPTLRILGRCEADAVNTTAAGYGSAGDISVLVKPGCFGQLNGAGSEAVTIADVGNVVYASGAQTISRTNGGGLYPAAGVLLQFNLNGDGVPYVLLGQGSLYDNNDDLPGGNTTALITARVKNVVNGNIADLTAYTVAANATRNDNTANVEGDIVLLVAQTTVAQNGLYRVGAVATGTAPLTRVSPIPAGTAFVADQLEITVTSGAIFGHTKWFNTASGTIGTNDPAFYPESVTISQVLTAGTAAAIQSIPLLSATKSNILYTRTATGGTLTTTIGYQTVPAPTPGPIGTASIVPMAVVAAGTIQNADTSTLLVTVVNR